MNPTTESTIVPFNRPFVVGNELHYIAQVVALGQMASDGQFTRRCSEFLEKRFAIPRVLLTPSCTAALEMAAILCDIQPGDEVVLPSYTFVSTASAFVRAGARLVFVDIRSDTLNIDETQIENAITERTKAISVVHYAGVACEMDNIMEVANRHGVRVVEDAAQGVNSFYKGRALGSIADIGCYSFHETKNYVCGEGGALCINDPSLVERAEIIRDKGTNRQEFFRGQVDKYTWVDIGSSFVPSELCSAFLFGQLEQLDEILDRRRNLHENYSNAFKETIGSGTIQIPTVPSDCVSNYHMFFVVFNSEKIRDAMIEHLNRSGVHAVTHYVPLHTSPFGRTVCAEGHLPVTDKISRTLLRLPFYTGITPAEQSRVVDVFSSFTASTA